jgi:hypothetical protein
MSLIISIVHCFTEFCSDMFKNRTCFLNRVQNKGHYYNTPLSKLHRFNGSAAYVMLIAS